MYFDALYTYVCVIGMGHCEHLIRFKQQAIIEYPMRRYGVSFGPLVKKMVDEG